MILTMTGIMDAQNSACHPEKNTLTVRSINFIQLLSTQSYILKG